MDRYLNPREAGQLLSMSPEAVRRLVRLGRLPAVRIGPRLRITERDLTTFMAEQVADDQVTARSEEGESAQRP